MNIKRLEAWSVVLCLLALVLNSSAATLYVDLTCTNPTLPYSDWGTATTNIQDAVDAASSGDQILVSNGVYTAGGRVAYGSLTNRLAVTKALTVRSANGPAFTVIQGYQMTGTTNGNSSVRCVYLTNNSALIGFTLMGGATRSAGDVDREQSGGGVWCADSSVVVSNCVLVNNFSGYAGGGARSGTLVSCTIRSNAVMGGRGWGGGTWTSALNNCTLSSNRGYEGGGTYGGTLTNCVVFGNFAGYGGGCFANNPFCCTIVSNTATSSGGGANGGGSGAMNNTICFYNSAPLGANFYGIKMNYCCTIPPDPFPCFSNAPLFLDTEHGNLHLQANSPCINAGYNGTSLPVTDLDGTPRLAGGRVDLGAYEFQAPASVLSYQWAQNYGLPTDGSADFTDSDGDGMNNWQEWRAGMDPTNKFSSLLISASKSVSGISLTWQSAPPVIYYLQRSTNLSKEPVFSTIQSNIYGYIRTRTFLDTTATNGAAYFYRVGVQMP